MTFQQIVDNIHEKRSFLCIGLDTDITRIPSFLKKEKDPVFEFNKRIIDATQDLCVAYKPNLAFYEALGPGGLESLERTVDYIPDNIFKIADAKRGDIGNTSRLYAKTFFERISFDAITINPYMGHDSVMPFLEYKDKWTIILALTSNPGSMDFQLSGQSGNLLYEVVIEKSSIWSSPEQIMYVVGATQAEYLKDIRQRVPQHFLLIPGIGAQGGDLESVVKYGKNDNIGLLINSSRSIIYASSDRDFEKDARNKAKELQEEMDKLMEKYF
jgi:orotidine-5'-phosphate decarboxylase